MLPPYSAEIRAGEFRAVVGRNGSGKTTFLKTLIGRLPSVNGEIERASPSLRIGYIPQKSALEEHYPLVARDVVSLGVERGSSFFGIRFREPAIVTEALAELGISDLANRSYSTLSEGQKQRILVARLIASKAQLVLLDEPTSAMDAVAEQEVFSMLDGLRKRHDAAILVVCHHLAVASRWADRLVFVDAESGIVTEGAPEEILALTTFRERYTSDRPDCVHELDPVVDSGGRRDRE